MYAKLLDCNNVYVVFMYWAGINTRLSVAGSSGGGKSDMFQYFCTVPYVYVRNSREGKLTSWGGKSLCSPGHPLNKSLTGYVLLSLQLRRSWSKGWSQTSPMQMASHHCTRWVFWSRGTKYSIAYTPEVSEGVVFVAGWGHEQLLKNLSFFIIPLSV